MINIKVLGPGCENCQRLETTVRMVVRDLAIEAEIEKVTNFNEIKKWNLMATPGLVVNNRVVSAGRIPAEDEIVEWLKS